MTRQAQAERWGSEAKRLADSGRDVAAFDLYRKAADILPLAPWLQLRTGELARKLKKHDLAINYFIRSGQAFIQAGFAKRSVAPLRQAWTVAREQLPGTEESFIDVARELAQVLKDQRFIADAEVLVEQTNEALRNCGRPQAFS
jgi:tetratricopeptide (TPR) repeat protein